MLVYSPVQGTGLPFLSCSSLYNLAILTMPLLFPPWPLGLLALPVSLLPSPHMAWVKAMLTLDASRCLCLCSGLYSPFYLQAVNVLLFVFFIFLIFLFRVASFSPDIGVNTTGPHMLISSDFHSENSGSKKAKRLRLSLLLAPRVYSRNRTH